MRITPGSTKAFLLSILDIPVFYGILCLTFTFRFHSGYFETPLGVPAFETYAPAFLAVSVFLWFLFIFTGQYQRGFAFNADNSWFLTQNLFIGFLCFTSFAFFYRETDYSRTTFVLALVFAIILMNLWAMIRAFLIKRIAPDSFRNQKLCIIGTSDRAIQLYENLRPLYGLQLSMVGPATIHLPANINFLGSLQDFAELNNKEKFDEVILALPSNSLKQALKIIEECQNRQIRFSVIPDLFDLVTQQVQIGQIHGVPVVSPASVQPTKSFQLKLKRAFDFSAASLSLAVMTPGFLLIAILIKFEDKGPVFYTQDRVGLDGAIFKIYKFRSMRQDAEVKSGPMWAIKGDPRWTVIGTILRRTSIDELPQLWNVVKGEMSLVGPRPERPVFVNEFKTRFPGYMLRHRMRGGLTGWSQVNGLRGQTSIEDRTTFDLYYIENWSFLFDIRILFQTVFKAVFIQSGY